MVFHFIDTVRKSFKLQWFQSWKIGKRKERKMRNGKEQGKIIHLYILFSYSNPFHFLHAIKHKKNISPYFLIFSFTFFNSTCNQTLKKKISKCYCILQSCAAIKKWKLLFYCSCMINKWLKLRNTSRYMIRGGLESLDAINWSVIIE